MLDNFKYKGHWKEEISELWKDFGSLGRERKDSIMKDGKILCSIKESFIRFRQSANLGQAHIILVIIIQVFQ